MKRRLPNKATVVLELHSEKRKVQTSEIIVVDAAIHESGWETYLANVLLDGEFGGPHGEGAPACASNGVVWHARVDVMLYASLLCGVGKRSAIGDLVSPVGGVDECILCALEEVVQESVVLKIADVDGHVGELRELLGYDAIHVTHLGAHLPSQGGCNPNEARRLAAIAIDGDDSPLHSWAGSGGEERRSGAEKRSRRGPCFQDGEDDGSMQKKGDSG